MIHHVLSETEPFSEQFGGALSRWVANVLREEQDFTVVCPWADTSWGFSPDRILSLSRLRECALWFKLLRSRHALDFRLRIIRSAFQPLFRRLNQGDTVYIHNRPDFALVIGEACRQSGAKAVLHLHNSHLLTMPRRLRSRLEVDAFVFCSEFLRSEAEAYAAGLTSVIPNGADELYFFPRNTEPATADGEPVVLFVGRLVPDKGVHVFVDAMRILKAKGVRARGKIIGSTEWGRNSSSPYVRRLKRSSPENVDFGNYVAGAALAEEFRHASIFCCPSVWNEPFGMVNVEAMATALPVVASAVGGIPEIFRDGGALLVPGGSASDLADALQTLLSNPAERWELGRRGYRSFQQRYRWRTIRAKYRAFLGELQATA